MRSSYQILMGLTYINNGLFTKILNQSKNQQSNRSYLQNAIQNVPDTLNWTVYHEQVCMCVTV